MSQKIIANTVVQNLSTEIPFVSFQEMGARWGPGLINLGNNLSPFPQPEDLLQDFSAQLDRLARNYGDPVNSELSQLLSEKFQVAKNEVLVSSGIDGLLCLLARTFLSQGDSVITSNGTYPTFGYFAKAQGSIVGYADYLPDYRVNLDELLSLAKQYQAKMIYLVNPDNPTGRNIDSDVLESFIQELPPETLLVLDEAYFHFVPTEEQFQAGKIVDNVLRLYSFSKAYGMAGLRLGYCIAPTYLIQEMNKVRIQFEVNGLAQWLGKELLKREALIRQNCQKTMQLLNFIATQAQAMGIGHIPSNTNFICLEFESVEEANNTQQLLLERHKIFTRKPSAAALSNLIRISIGQQDELEYLIIALEKIRR